MRCTSLINERAFAQRGLKDAKRFVESGANSANEFVRPTIDMSQALRQEGLKGIRPPLLLADFSNDSCIKNCKTMSDQELGGHTVCSLSAMPADKDFPMHVKFHGDISTELPHRLEQVERSGFAGWRTDNTRHSLWGTSAWDLDTHAMLALRIKSDGRSYHVNLQSDSIVPEDIHQHRLFARSSGIWEIVFINLRKFVRTNRGEIIEPQNEILTQRVRTVGISLTDRIPGPFELAIHQIWAVQNEIDMPPLQSELNSDVR